MVSRTASAALGLLIMQYCCLFQGFPQYICSSRAVKFIEDRQSHLTNGGRGMSTTQGERDKLTHCTVCSGRMQCVVYRVQCVVFSVYCEVCTSNPIDLVI